MTISSLESSAPAEVWLREHGYACQRLDYCYHEGGGIPDASAQLSLSAHLIIKSLVFCSPEGKPVMALMHGDCRVSVRKLERAAAVRRLLPCSPEQALEFTGYTPGGICPFCLPADFPIFLQESLLALPEVCINAGQRGVVVRIMPRILLTIGAHPCDILSLSKIHKEGPCHL